MRFPSLPAKAMPVFTSDNPTIQKNQAAPDLICATNNVECEVNACQTD